MEHTKHEKKIFMLIVCVIADWQCIIVPLNCTKRRKKKKLFFLDKNVRKSDARLWFIYFIKAVSEILTSTGCYPSYNNKMYRITNLYDIKCFCWGKKCIFMSVDQNSGFKMESSDFLYRYAVP